MDTFVQLVEARYCRREMVAVLHHNVDRLVGWLLPSSDPPAPHSLLPAARWRGEGGGCKELILLGVGGVPTQI